MNDSEMSTSNKRQWNDNDENKGGKRRRTGDAVMRILIPSCIAGGIIGKSGDNIRNMNSEYDIKMSLHQSHTAERVIVITAPLDNICKALYDLVPRMEELKDEKGVSDKSCIRLLVLDGYAGKIIGKGGKTITDMNEEVGGNVKIFVPLCPQSNERVAHVKGTVDQIVRYVRAIYELINDVDVKGSTVEYDAQNADEFYAYEYGGFVNPKGQGVGRRGRGGGGFNRGRGERDGRSGYSKGDDRYDSDRGNGFTPRGGRGGSRGGSRGGRQMNNDFPLMGGFKAGLEAGIEAISSQVSIPKRLAGAVIGKSGSRIRQIQVESCTKIKISDEAEDSDERIITIFGNQDQIQYAQYLLQNAIKNYS